MIRLKAIRSFRPLVPVLLLCLVPAAAMATDLTGRPEIVDGDTLTLAGQTIHLHGIDAPELDQTCLTGRHKKPFDCGVRAATALRDLIGRETVTCHSLGEDPAGGIVATCTLGRFDLGEQMVVQGWAVAAPDSGAAYRRAEEAARRLHEGLWRHQFAVPWEWRREKAGKG